MRDGRAILSVGALDVGSGELLAVVGPNGSGKSTLLKVLALVLRPDCGSIQVSEVQPQGIWDGNPAALLGARRKITMVFQSPVMLMRSVYDNVAAGLRFRGTVEPEVRRRTAFWLERLGIRDLATRRPVGLSGGEAQRVALARALVLQPDLLLLDEPTANLDWPTRTKLMGDLRAILGEIRAGAVLVTHDIHEAPHFADRLLVMRDGHVVQEGPPAAVVENPADVETAVFLGYDNVLPARMVRLGGEMSLGGREDQAFCIGPERVRLQRITVAGGLPNAAPAQPAGPGGIACVNGLITLQGKVLRVVPWGPLYRVSIGHKDARDGLVTGTCDAQDLRDGSVAEGRPAQLVFAATDGVLVPLTGAKLVPLTGAK